MKSIIHLVTVSVVLLLAMAIADLMRTGHVDVLGTPRFTKCEPEPNSQSSNNQAGSYTTPRAHVYRIWETSQSLYCRDEPTV